MIACVFFLIAGVNATAAAPAVWYFQTTVNYVYAGQIGNWIAISVGATVDFGTCLVPGNPGEFTLDPSNPYFKTMLTLIMIAYTTGKPISVYTSGVCTSWGVTLTDVRLP